MTQKVIAEVIPNTKSMPRIGVRLFRRTGRTAVLTRGCGGVCCAGIGFGGFGDPSGSA